MDNLERFIKENRSEFDDQVPSLDAWSKITDQLDQQQPTKVRHLKIYSYVGRVAAACLLLFVGAYSSHTYFQQQTIEGLSYNIDELAPEYANEVEFYQQQVNLKMNSLANYESVHMVTDDMLQLDESFEELLTELKDVPYHRRAQVIQALIQNFENKINVLDKVLEEVEESNINRLNSVENEQSL